MVRVPEQTTTDLITYGWTTEETSVCLKHSSSELLSSCIVLRNEEILSPLFFIFFLVLLQKFTFKSKRLKTPEGLFFFRSFEIESCSCSETC